MRRMNFRAPGAEPPAPEPPPPVIVTVTPPPPVPVEVKAPPPRPRRDATPAGPAPGNAAVDGLLRRGVRCIITGHDVPAGVVFPDVPPPGPVRMNVHEPGAYTLDRMSPVRFSTWHMASDGDPPLTRVRLHSPGVVHDTERGAAHRIRMAPYSNVPPEHPEYVQSISGNLVRVLVDCDEPPPYGKHTIELMAGSRVLTREGTSCVAAEPPPGGGHLHVPAVSAWVSFSDVYRHQAFSVVLGRAEPWMIHHVDVACLESGRVCSLQNRTLEVRGDVSWNAPVLNVMHHGWVVLHLDLQVHAEWDPQHFVARFHQRDGTITAVAFVQPGHWRDWYTVAYNADTGERMRDREMMGPGWNR